jgi:RNA polymerase sigma-70 factor, ECF subfamily
MSMSRSTYFRLANEGSLLHNLLSMLATATADFEGLVEQYYRSLYHFALSLTGMEAEACDLTQQTFYIWARKGHQLRDTSKVKTWLFTTLHREFLKSKRRSSRFPHHELEEVERELPAVDPVMVNQLDADSIVAAMGQVNELYRTVLTLFYLEDLSYRDIAETLDVPIGTVQSRIARGKAELQQLLSSKELRG